MKRKDLLNSEQAFALEAMLAWVKSPSSFFLLQGSAGTGKTFTARAFADEVKGRLVFTAPTNKATKVLRESLTDKEYKPECRTIFSLLGLKLEANGEVKELSSPEDPIDLTQYTAVLVDEGSMVNEIVMGHIRTCAMTTGVKFLFMGDPAQLPPVGETRSGIWSIEDKALLDTVMRHDNQILTLATALRRVVDHPVPKITMQPDNNGEEGVWYMSQEGFQAGIVKYAKLGGFSKPEFVKAIAWRNVTVDSMNRLIRKTLFDEEAVCPWLVTDRVVFTGPAKDLEDNTVATTDDEGRVDRVEEAWHPVYSEFKIWRMTIVLDDNKVVGARVLHEECLGQYNARVERLATEARQDKRKWRHFWDFKDSFHGLRHSYAITAHRAQGSTYDTVFVDWRDILLNRNRQEAFRCLYVACSRPKKRLFLG